MERKKALHTEENNQNQFGGMESLTHSPRWGAGSSLPLSLDHTILPQGSAIPRKEKSLRKFLSSIKGCGRMYRGFGGVNCV